MTSEVVHIRKFRGAIPEAHQVSLDTRLHWLWHQRFGTVQMVWKVSQQTGAVLDHTAATLVLQAIIGKDLESIAQLFQRIEGGARIDEDLLDEEETIRI